MDLETFYRENYPIVFGYLFSLCRDLHTAEDLTSETFLRAMQKINSFDGKVKASTWLCTIGKNLWLDQRKKECRSSLADLPDLTDRITPEDRYLQRQKLDTLEKLVRELEEPKDQVFLMRVQGMSFRQIGAALGRTENWARVTYFRIKEQIWERLEEFE